MNKKYIVIGLVVLGAILAVPIYTYAFGGMLGSGRTNMNGAQGQGMQGGIMNGMAGRSDRGDDGIRHDG